MNFDMVKYVLSITTEHITKLDILNQEITVNLHEIIQKKAMELNDTIIDISDYSYVGVLDYDFQDEIIFVFYNYQDMGDSGMDLVHETTITTKLSTLDSFQILMDERYGKCSICGVQIPRNSTEELHYDLEEYGNPAYCKKCWDMKEKDSSKTEEHNETPQYKPHKFKRSRYYKVE